MFSLLMRFAAEDGPSVHIAPAEVFHIGGLTISNSILYGWISTILMIVLLVGVARRISVKPRGGLTQFIEVGTEFMINTIESSFIDKQRGRKYIPFFITVFFFILLSNWFGLIPLVGEGFQHDGHPIFRPFTADLNGTLAIGIVTMVFVYVASVREMGGFRKYLRHFFVGSPLNPLFFAIGILEMFTDLTRVFSLALRLFLNVTIGEIIIAVFSYLGHTYASPFLALPFTLMELLVGALQAYIFALLSMMYLSIVVNHATEHELEHGHDDPTADLTPSENAETIGAKAII